MALASVVLAALAWGLSAPSQAAEKENAVGYGGAKVQLSPLMAPTRGLDGKVKYEVLTVRLILDVGERERDACFTVPYVHEQLLFYLYTANLTAADFVGERLKLLGKKLFEVVIDATTKGLFSGVEIVTEDTPPLTQAADPKSFTMTSQCK